MTTAALFVGLAFAADPAPAPAEETMTQPVEAAAQAVPVIETAEDMNAKLEEVLERLRAVQAAAQAAAPQEGVPVEKVSSGD